MPERPTPPPESEASRAPLFTAQQIRLAFVASAVGMVGLLVVFLLLASSRPQGAYRIADDEQFQALLGSAAEDLDGYELLPDGRARIDIDRAIEIVAERGVDLPLTAIGSAAASRVGGEAPGAGAAAAAGDADGGALYAANCASCHQAQGQGLPGAFPPLANGHMPSLVAAEGGRDYLIRVLLYGLQGEIEVEGQSYDGLMPAWPQLSDADIAAVLNHELTAWGNEDALPETFEPIVADEVAAARGEDLSASEVLELRPDPAAVPAEGAGRGEDVAAGEAADGGASDAEGAGDEAAAEGAAGDAAANAPEEAAAGGPGGAAAVADAGDESAYAANCASCHQAEGQGVPGAFPPLAEGHMPSLLAADGGREYLLHVLVYGLQGPIQVGGQSYDGLMPAWPQLDDATIAGILNHELAAWGNADALPDEVEPIAADEVAAVRGQDLSPADVLEMRPALD